MGPSLPAFDHAFSKYNSIRALGSKVETGRRRVLLCIGMACAGVSACPSLVWARGDSGKLRFDIAVQDLAAALFDFARRANLQILAPAALLSGRVSHEVRGEFLRSEALTRLLEGTGLRGWIEGDVIRLQRAGPAAFVSRRSPLPASARAKTSTG